MITTTVPTMQFPLGVSLFPLIFLSILGITTAQRGGGGGGREGGGGGGEKQEKKEE